MNKYVFEGKNFENCVVFTDDRFGEIRVMLETEGENLYVAIDIAACMGYAAPGKAVARCGISSKIRMVPWIFKKKQGAASTHCFTEEEARQFIDRGQELPEGFREWFFEEVVKQARNLKASENPLKDDKLLDDVKSEEEDVNAIFKRFDSLVMEMLTLKMLLIDKMN